MGITAIGEQDVCELYSSETLGLPGDHIERLAVSAEYPVYEIDQKQADGRYLELVVRSSAFLRLLDGLSHGGSTKTRIPSNEFDKQTIPLHPLQCKGPSFLSEIEPKER